MDFRLLGNLELVAGDRSVWFCRRQERCLLSILLLAANRSVPVERLAELIWADRPPQGVRATLRTYVSRLRTTLANVAGHKAAALVSHTGGYLLEVDPHNVDAHRFDAGLERARAIREPNRRAELLRQALALWRGPALADVGPEPVRRRLVTGLEQRRVQALDLRITADLACGRHTELLAELSELLSRDATNETLTGHLMVALYRTGRRVDSLATYRELDRSMREQLGLEPGVRLQRLHRAILQDEPWLLTGEEDDFDRAGGMPRWSRSTIPAQLPTEPVAFAGRTMELAEMDRLLLGGTSDGMSIVVLSGTAGVGKTGLAVRWAHRMADQFPDGQLFADLRGWSSDPPISVHSVLAGFLRALGAPPAQVPAGLDEAAALYRSLLAGRRLLVVLDNAQDERQVRPLLPGAAGCAALVTSRNHLAGLVAAEGAQSITLDLLTAAEARQLLAGRVGSQRVEAEPQEVDEIITRCAGLPLALGVAAAQAAIRPDLPLAALAAELRQTSGGLAAFSSNDAATNMRAVLSWSYRALSPAAARLFRLLGLHPGADFGTWSAASLAGVAREEVRPLLAELADANLVSQGGAGRHRLHDLLRAYATELVSEEADQEGGDEGRTALRRVLDHYLHTAQAASQLLRPDPGTLSPPEPGTRPEPIVDPADALAWFTAEHAVLVAAVEQAASAGFDAPASDLAWALEAFLDRHGHWSEMATTQTIALAAAGRLADRIRQARADRGLARAYLFLGRYDEAYAHCQHALALFDDLADPVGSAHIHRILAWLYEAQRQYRKALDHAKQAHALFATAGHSAGHADTLNQVGWLHALRGNYREAITHSARALTLQEERGSERGQAAALDSLGFAHHQLGHHDQAIIYYQRSLALLRELQDRYNQTEVLTHLGDAHHTVGDRDTARCYWQRALYILDHLGHAKADQVRARLRHNGSAVRPCPAGSTPQSEQSYCEVPPSRAQCLRVNCR